MNSIAFKLAGLFLILVIVPLGIGIGGSYAMKLAGASLDDNNRALQNLSNVLAATGDSLDENVRLQNEAQAVTNKIAKDQEGISVTLKEMGDSMLPRTFAISQMRFALIDASAAERALLLTLNMRHLDNDELREKRDSQIANINAALGNLESARKAYLNLLVDDEEKRVWADFEAALAEWQANHREFMTEIAKLDALVDDLVRGGPLFASAARQAYDTVFVSGRSAREACESSIDLLYSAIANSAERDVHNAMAAQASSQRLVHDLDRETEALAAKVNSLREQIAVASDTANRAAAGTVEAVAYTSRRYWLILVVSVIGVLVVLALGLALAWRISRHVRHMTTHMGQLARGDVSEDVPGEELERSDEIGQFARAMQDMIVSSRAEIKSANAMADGDYTLSLPLRSENDQLGKALGSMVKTTNSTLARVSQMVNRVSVGASEVTKASNSLLEGANTSAMAVEEISHTVNAVDQQAQENATHATEANHFATVSRDAARRGYDAVTELVTAMAEIQQAGKKIAVVAKLIDDIAFQTNLLALNAAVEAARAGRQGKGFSVVADEVRNLSGRSAKAARETSAMVEAMTKQMEDGELLAERTDRELREIVEATEQVAKLFADINEASNDQSKAMAQIAGGLNQIDGVIQANTQNAGQTASAAQSLLSQAEDLRHVVARFKLFTPDIAMRRLEASPREREARETSKNLDGPRNLFKTNLLSAPADDERRG